MSSISALRSRDFRLYWIALIVSATGTWLQIVALSLLVLRLTHGSATALGLVALAQALAFFVFALAGGTFADRFDRRRLLLLTQSVLMLLALLLGVLTAAAVVRLWMVVALAFLSGTVLSFDQPTRAAFLPSLVPEPGLMSAISLQAMVFTGTSALAPSLAGILIERFGLASNFFLNAASYLAVILLLLFLRPKSIQNGRSRHIHPLLPSVRAGLKQIRGDRALFWALSGYAVLLFGAPSMPLLLPVFALRVLHTGARSLGLLFSAFGAGAVGGALLVPWLGRVLKKGHLYLGAFALLVCALSWFAASRKLESCVVALLLAGAAHNALSVTTITLLQSRVAPGMRGRMMSLNTLLLMGVRPLGDFPLSLLISALGAPAAALLSALLIGAYGLYLALTRSLRDL